MLSGAQSDLALKPLEDFVVDSTAIKPTPKKTYS
jgi:hypothetical protein